MSYTLGAWLAVCDRCGKKYMASQLCLEWTGLRTCRGPGTHSCWDPKHPQEGVRGKPDHQAPPWTRPEQTISEVNSTTPDDL